MRFSYAPTVGQDYNGDGYSDQWLDIYIPNSPPPPEGFPVLIHAHAANQVVDDLCLTASTLNSLGMVMVVWESVNEDAQSINGSPISSAFAYGNADFDFQRVLRWVRDKAAIRTGEPIDLDQVFVSGSSRGARISFNQLTEVINLINGQPLVKAAAFSQAFPDLEWTNSSQSNGEFLNAIQVIEPEYPPVIMIYQKNPGVIDDIHDPLNGISVLEELQCQNIPSQLIYNLPTPIFSPSGIGNLVQYMNDPLGYIDSFNRPVIGFSDSIAPMSLKAPKEVELILNANDPTRFKVEWKQDGWSEVESTPVRVECELRGAPIASGDFCQYATFQSIIVNDYTGKTPLPENYQFPKSGFLNACNLPSNIQAGVTYNVQARCFIRVEDISPGSTITPWSEPVSVQVPSCDGNLLNQEESSPLKNLSASRWLIDLPSSDMTHYQLRDLQGRLLLSAQSTENELDLSGFPIGLYLLDLWQGDQHSQFKLMNIRD